MALGTKKAFKSRPMWSVVSPQSPKVWGSIPVSSRRNRKEEIINRSSMMGSVLQVDILSNV